MDWYQIGFCQLVSSFFSTHALAGPTFAISMRTFQVQSDIARKKEKKLENLSKI
jgi:hypothetical protein